jgi:hypothetical protein
MPNSCRTLRDSLLCDVDIGHEFWTRDQPLAVGERRLSQKRSVQDSLAWTPIVQPPVHVDLGGFAST